jgi:hypothetical protein
LPAISSHRIYHAISDSDPATDVWQQAVNGNNYYGGDPFQHGINCVRGQAAQAISSLLYDDQARYSGLLPALEALAQDPIISVRTCAINALVPLLNFARDAAVDLFLRACGQCDAICGTNPFDRFVHHAMYTHYGRLRDLLQFALRSVNAGAVEIAARQITLAELGGVDVGDDASNIRTGNETMRKAAAHVFARNLSGDAAGDKCAKRLEEFFSDASSALATAAFSFSRNQNLPMISGLLKRVAKARFTKRLCLFETNLNVKSFLEVKSHA